MSREQPMCWTRPELQSGIDGQAQKVGKWTTHIDVAAAAAAAADADDAGDIEEKRKGRKLTDRIHSIYQLRGREFLPGCSNLRWKELRPTGPGSKAQDLSRDRTERATYTGPESKE